MKTMSAVVLALVLTLGNSARADDKEKDVIETAVEAGKFSVLVKLVKEAGLVETLKGKGPFTVFAPTDEAFKKLPDETVAGYMKDKEALRKLLLTHIVVGQRAKAVDVVKLNGNDVNGFMVKAADERVMIGNASVTKTDVTASNGVIHVIDTVLVPAAK